MDAGPDSALCQLLISIFTLTLICLLPFRVFIPRLWFGFVFIRS